MDVAVDTTHADPSAATETTLEVPQDGRAYAEWRQSGKLPERKPAAAAEGKNQPPKTEKSAPPSESSPASEADHQERRPRDNAQTRLNELLTDLREAGLSPAQLKTFKQDWQKAQRDGTKEPQPPAATPAEKTVNPAATDRPKRPKMAEHNTLDEYEAAMDKYEDNLAAWNDQQAESKQAQRVAQQSMHQKMQDASKRYGAEAVPTISATARAIGGDQAISPAVKQMLDGSPVMTDVLYVFGSKPEDLQAFVEEARSNPAAAIRRIVLTEQLVQAELTKSGTAAGSAAAEDEGDGQTARGEDGKFVSSKTHVPETKVSRAPDPPHEVSGRSSAPGDVVESAVRNNDFGRFRDEQNARDLARRKGR